MRKLTVTEYLIAQNQAQSVTTSYHSMHAAIGALLENMDAIGNDYNVRDDSEIQDAPELDESALGLNYQHDGSYILHILHVDGAYIIHAWYDVDTDDRRYTIHTYN